MIGLGPHMGVTYVSKMFGGRASDCHVTRESRDLSHNLRYISKLDHRIYFLKGVRSVNECEHRYFTNIFPWSVTSKERKTSNSKCNIILFTPLDHLYNAKQEGLLISFFQMFIILQTVIHPDTQRKLEWGTKVFCSSMNSMKKRSSSTNQPLLEQTSLNMT